MIVKCELMVTSLTIPGRTGRGSPVCSYCFLDGGAFALHHANTQQFRSGSWVTIDNIIQPVSGYNQCTKSLESMIRLAAEFLFRSCFASDPGGLGLGAHCGNGNISFVFL